MVEPVNKKFPPSIDHLASFGRSNDMCVCMASEIDLRGPAFESHLSLTEMTRGSINNTTFY